MIQIYTRVILMIVALFSLSACAGKSKRYSLKKPTNLEMMATKSLTKQDSAKVLSAIKPAVAPSKKLSNHYHTKPDQIMRVDIANKGYSRFSIEGERITDVFVYPQESINLKIHDQGYLIVVPDREKLAQTGWPRIYLTLTGEQGTTQDIYLRFREGNPSPITFIKSSTTKSKEENNHDL